MHIVDSKGNSMDKHIKAFLAAIEDKQKRPVQDQVKSRDRQLAVLQRRIEPLQQQIDKAQTELNQARDYLASIPISAEPADITLQQTILDKWPNRISQIRSDIAKLGQEKSEVEN